jgi:multiple sugar transport system substrate-binding protein
MKRILYGLFYLLLLLTFIVGVRAQEKTKIVVAARLTHAERVAMWQKWVDDYNKANPHIGVELIHGGDNYYDNLLTWIAGGAAPDIMWMGGDVWRFVDVLLPLNDLYARDPVVREILPNLIQTYSWNGIIFCLPYGVNTHVMYYNQTIFNNQGITMKSNWTWDDAIQMGKKATVDTNGDGTVDQWGMYIYNNNWAITYGGHVYTPDMRRVDIENKATATGLEIVMDISSGRNPIGFTQPTVYGGATNAVNGKIAMGHIGVWEVPTMLSQASFEWDVTLFPSLIVEGRKYDTSVYSIESWAAYKGTKHPAEVEDFLSYLLSRENMVEFAAMGTVVPSQPRVATQTFMTIKKPQHISVFAEALNFWKQNPADHPAYPDLNWWNTGTWDKMAKGEIPVATGLADMARTLNQQLDEWYSRKGL